MERIRDPLGRDRILGVAGVADERPPGTVWRAEEVGDGCARESGFALGTADTVGELGCELEGLEVVGFDVGLVRVRLRIGPPDDEHREPIVRLYRGEAAIGTDHDLEAVNG